MSGNGDEVTGTDGLGTNRDRDSVWGDDQPSDDFYIPMGNVTPQDMYDLYDAPNVGPTRQ